MLSADLKTPWDVQQEIASRFKKRRLAMNLTQEGLAARSGVSWGSVKRFETSAMISLESLLKIALVLDCLGDFDQLCNQSALREGRSLDSILSSTQPRQKGRLK